MLWKIYVCARTLVRQLPDLPDRLLYGPASLHIACPKKLEAASRSSKTYMAIRTVEEDLRQFNLGLASGLRRNRNSNVTDKLRLMMMMMMMRDLELAKYSVT